MSKTFPFSLTDVDGRRIGAMCHALEVQVAQNGAAWDVIVTAWSGGKDFVLEVSRGVTREEADQLVGEFTKLHPTFFGD